MCEGRWPRRRPAGSPLRPAKKPGLGHSAVDRCWPIWLGERCLCDGPPSASAGAWTTRLHLHLRRSAAWKKGIAFDGAFSTSGRGFDVSLLLVGAGEDAERLRRRLASVPAVAFTGFVQRQEIPLYMPPSDVAILPLWVTRTLLVEERWQPACPSSSRTLWRDTDAPPDRRPWDHRADREPRALGAAMIELAVDPERRLHSPLAPSVRRRMTAERPRSLRRFVAELVALPARHTMTAVSPAWRARCSASWGEMVTIRARSPGRAAGRDRSKTRPTRRNRPSTRGHPVVCRTLRIGGRDSSLYRTAAPPDPDTCQGDCRRRSKPSARATGTTDRFTPRVLLETMSPRPYREGAARPYVGASDSPRVRRVHAWNARSEPPPARTISRIASAEAGAQCESVSASTFSVSNARLDAKLHPRRPPAPARAHRPPPIRPKLAA